MKAVVLHFGGRGNGGRGGGAEGEATAWHLTEDAINL